MKIKYAILDEIKLKLLSNPFKNEVFLFEDKDEAVKTALDCGINGYQIIEIPFGEEEPIIVPLSDEQKRSLTEYVRAKVGQDYIHIPKCEWLRKVLQEVLYIGKVRGRTPDREALEKDGVKLGYKDGTVPMKYAKRYYLPLK